MNTLSSNNDQISNDAVPQDLELDDGLDRGEATERPPQPKEISIEVLMNDWQLAEDMRLQAQDLGIITKAENAEYAIDDSLPSADEIRKRYEDIQEALKADLSAESREWWEAELLAITIDFSYNTTMLLRGSFNNKMKEFLKSALASEEAGEEKEDQLERTYALIQLIKSSGKLLTALDVFKIDSENILTRADSNDEDSRFRSQMYGLNQEVYKVLGKPVEDLPSMDQSQAKVLPDLLNELTDVKPDQVARVLELLESYHERLLHDLHPEQSASQQQSLDETDEQVTADEIKGEVQDTFNLPEETEEKQAAEDSESTTPAQQRIQ